MTNREYFENIVNSNLDDEAKALALTVLVNSVTKSCYVNTVTPNTNSYANGTENRRVDVKASLVALIFDYLTTHEEFRCKDIANEYNCLLPLNDNSRFCKASYRDVAAITTKLVDMGLLVRTKKPETVLITREEFRAGQTFTLSQERVIDVPYFSLPKN